ncbi:MAG: DsbA family protein [Pseudomonadota bacterium]
MAEQGSLVRLHADYDFEIDWRGFELHPETPPGGMSLGELFGSARIPAMHEHLQRFALGFGITDMNPPDHLPNTRRALALAEYARQQGCLEPFRVAAMNAHWRQQRNLEDDGVLMDLAREVGLDPVPALAAADSAPMLARVDAMRAEANAAGVRGIPTFFAGDLEIVGCQPVEVLQRALVAAGAQRR